MPSVEKSVCPVRAMQALWPGSRRWRQFVRTSSGILNVRHPRVWNFIPVPDPAEFLERVSPLPARFHVSAWLPSWWSCFHMFVQPLLPCSQGVHVFPFQRCIHLALLIWRPAVPSASHTAWYDVLPVCTVNICVSRLIGYFTRDEKESLESSFVPNCMFPSVCLGLHSEKWSWREVELARIHSGPPKMSFSWSLGYVSINQNVFKIWSTKDFFCLFFFGHLERAANTILTYYHPTKWATVLPNSDSYLHPAPAELHHQSLRFFFVHQWTLSPIFTLLSALISTSSWENDLLGIDRSFIAENSCWL